MAHGLDPIETAQTAAPIAGAAGPVGWVIAALNQAIVIVSSVALLGAALVLTYSVIVRYFLKFSTDWQDEMSVFLIIGAVFMSAAAIQARSPLRPCRPARPTRPRWCKLCASPPPLPFRQQSLSICHLCAPNWQDYLAPRRRPNR